MGDELATIVDGALDAHSVRGKRVAVALSGGLDSVVLLNLLHERCTVRELSLSAIHVNHQLSSHADEWEHFCRALCERYGVGFIVRRVQVTPDGSGIEAAARQLRYRAFASVDADFVALGHHLDDQVETFLLQLLRGAGPKGLAAMPVVRQQESGVDDKVVSPLILRPLLELRRSRIEAYATSKGLEWVDDDSNADSRFDRNYLRNELLRPLEARFPGYRETLARAARNLADHALLAEELARIDAQSLDRKTVSAERLRQLSDARALNLLRQLFSELFELQKRLFSVGTFRYRKRARHFIFLIRTAIYFPFTELRCQRARLVFWRRHIIRRELRRLRRDRFSVCRKCFLYFRRAHFRQFLSRTH